MPAVEQGLSAAVYTQLSDVEDEELVDPVDLAAEYNLDDPVRMYLKEIGQVKLLSADELPKFHISEIYAGTLYEAAMGLKELMYYFVINNSDLTADDVDKLIQPPKGPGMGEDDDDEASRYLSDDGRIVSVTYGTKNADGSYTAYKTFILNYNNFSVNVEYNEVTYTIPAYGYVVVMH